MTYMCLHCGEILEESDLGGFSSYFCDYGGSEVYEELSCCPSCNGTDFAEAEECEICGDWHIKEHGYDDVQMYDGYCHECLLKSTVEDCLKVAKGEGKHMVEINAFLASSYTPAEIEEILADALRKNPIKAIKEYVDGDPEWFAERLRKEKN